MGTAIPSVLIVEDDPLDGRFLRDIVSEIGARPLGPIPGVLPALAMIDGVPMDAALLAVRVDDGLSFPVAAALDAKCVPYAFVTAVPDMVEARAAFAVRPLVMKPARKDEIAAVLRECGLPV